MTEKTFLGTFAPPANYKTLPKAEKRAWAKCVCDAMRERMGLPPTDEHGNAPKTDKGSRET
jgi:hypothetical protein